MMKPSDKSAPAVRHPTEAESRLVEGKVRAASRALLIEKLWPRLWLPVAIAGIFVLLSAFEVWQRLPGGVHLYALWGFGAAFVLSLIPLFVWKRPQRQSALDRIERTSKVEHRPLTAFGDTLAQADASSDTETLWQLHQARAARELDKLRPGLPRPRVDRYDPFALRAVLVLLLVVAFAWASDLGGRIGSAFKVEGAPVGAQFRIDAWVSAPAYTRKDPFVLPPEGARDAISVPQGSILTVKINGSDASHYAVTLDQAGERMDLKPSAQTGDDYAEYAQKLDVSGTLAVRRRFAADRVWPLTVVPDRAPTIAFVGPIEVSPRQVMQFKYKVDDDYGVVAAEARIERMPAPPSANGVKGGREAFPQIGKPPVFALSLPHAPATSGEGKTYKDLTEHPWAGLPVVVTLIARDEAGNEGQSAPRGLILPERKFTKPLARAVIDQRRSLVDNPADVPRIAGNLNAIAIGAEDEGVAPTIYLSLRSAFWRLRRIQSVEDLESIVDQLWDVALRIEDGNLSSAERDLRAAQDRLKDAIENGASEQEIQKLMSELRQALNQYLQALMQQQAARSERSFVNPNAKAVSPRDLQQLLDKIESLAKSGSPDAAAQMLNQLRDILESLQTGKRGGKSGEEQAESMRQLDKLTGIMRQQQQLLDQTFRAQQNGEAAGQDDLGAQQPGSGQREDGAQGEGDEAPSAGALGRRQTDLQKQLQDLMGQMPAGKDSETMRRKLEEALSAMGEAGDALQQNDLGEAGEQEGRALENLRQGARALAEQMMRAGSAMRGQGEPSRDPLGRPLGNPLDPGDSVKVPDEITVQRAREILDELRKRLGQPSRPALELDYLERLVKPY